MQETTLRRTLLTVRQFAERNPAFSQGALRSLIFLSQPRRTSKGDVQGNGLSVALVRVGRKVLIDEVLFFEWLDEQNSVNASPRAPKPGVSYSGTVLSPGSDK